MNLMISLKYFIIIIIIIIISGTTRNGQVYVAEFQSPSPPSTTTSNTCSHSLQSLVAGIDIG